MTVFRVGKDEKVVSVARIKETEEEGLVDDGGDGDVPDSSHNQAGSDLESVATADPIGGGSPDTK